MRRRFIGFALGMIACGGGGHSTTTVAPTASAPPAATASASASAAHAKPIKPPSTGKEFVAPTIKPPSRDEARAMLGKALGAAQAKDCVAATSPRAQTGFNFAGVDAPFVRSNEPGLLAFARCAEGRHLYRLLGAVAFDLGKADPKFHPELLARALLGIGHYTTALAVLKEIAKTAPRDPDIALTTAKAHCRAADWASCSKLASETLQLVGAPTTAEAKDVAWRADKYRARALVHLGKFDEASKAADEAEKLGAPANELDEVKKMAVRGKAHKILVEVSYGTSIPLGGYHLFGKVPAVGSIVTVAVSNLDAKDHEVKIEAAIAGITEKTTKTITLLKGKTETVNLDPPLRAGYDVNAIRADTGAQIDVHAIRTDGSDELYEESLPVTLMPRDSLPVARVMQDGEARRVTEFVGAWVTPNAKAVDTFLAAAKKRLAVGQSFSGGQAPTMPQVQAIYDELRARGVSYVMDPDIFVEGQVVQRTRLPSEILESTNAQCIEGAILYATLFEAIGLHPYVTLAKSHSWAGWKPEGHDTTPPRAPHIFWLETTVTHDATFLQALAVGNRMFYVEHAADWVAPRGAAPIFGWVDIAALRSHGVTPQPWNL